MTVIRPRVLIIDDDAVQIIMLKTLFEGVGIEVVTSLDAETALTQIRTSRFDLVISDLVLPGLSGHDLVGRVAALPSFQQVPVIIVTSDESEKARQRSQALGAVGHLTKPLALEAVFDIIRNNFPDRMPGQEKPSEAS